MHFDHVAFSYPDGRTVFSDFDLLIPAGQTVASSASRAAASRPCSR
jgi:ABC-type multidrug transport system fused ATPase/permease subunit